MADRGGLRRLFAYGTLLRGESNHAALGEARFLGSASTAAIYELRDLGPYPAMVPGGQTAILGELYEIGPETVRRLDDLEGHPDFYYRADVSIQGGETALAYLMPPDTAEEYPVVASGDWRRR